MTVIRTINYPNYSKEILKIRNYSYVRKSCLDQNKISYNDHLRWYKNFNNEKNIIKGIFIKKKLIGYVRIEISNNKFASWYLEKKYWGKVNFYKILKNCTFKRKVRAKIKINNIRSIIVAIKAGFNFEKKVNNSIYLIKN